MSKKLLSRFDVAGLGVDDARCAMTKQVEAVRPRREPADGRGNLDGARARVVAGMHRLRVHHFAQLNRAGNVLAFDGGGRAARWLLGGDHRRQGSREGGGSKL